MSQKFHFLCGVFNNKNFVYGVKFDELCWHYFDKLDSIDYEHISLPLGWSNKLNGTTGFHVVELMLNEEQAAAYYNNGSFVFRNKELKTCKLFP